jgi:hypothetical protein
MYTPLERFYQRCLAPDEDRTPVMCQAEEFDPETIDRELGWAAAMGMNTVHLILTG